ncbi:Peptidase S10 serine carboxypeptidase [Macrophomina phaseolina MS6]|uniref:Carboxypeptidase n=1 Tax=Macrophomina phaseolina (strain MS6) TaxID=1126212 RepID=K2S7P0_MACPH|nr:Peptidase S10 serine carboxypeptidase [Macrophomina phaseolina MS6]
MRGLYEPVRNHYAWNNLSNIVWIEQPVGTGYTRGQPNATSEDDIVRQFSGFWKSFMDLFELHNSKIYITGESYAGMYVPYIADYFLNQSDTTYFNVSGIMIYDPSINHDVVLQDAPVLSLIENSRNAFPFNNSFDEYIRNRSSACGFDDLLVEGLKFPPDGHFDLPKGAFPNGSATHDCTTWDDAATAAFYLNPCFNYYQVTQLCPIPWDVMGFPSSIFYLPSGYPGTYFNRSEVKSALNVPQDANWTTCSDKPVFIGGADNSSDLSAPSGLNGGPLARVTERTNNVIIGTGNLDMVIITNGTLISLNNMTWNGAQGFSKPPDEPFYVPDHDIPSVESMAGIGILGSWGADRGLTYVAVELSGHAVPGFAQSAGYRHLELLLGRIANFSDTSPFTTQPDYPQPAGPLGKGTSPPRQAVMG